MLCVHSPLAARANSSHGTWSVQRLVREQIMSLNSWIILTSENSCFISFTRLLTDYCLLSYPPFTIQRVCELALNPQDHYSSVGKYLRAIERSLFVTSTWDQYALDTYALDNAGPSVVSSTAIETLKHATTPLFSPIPFLHHANSPPPSPFLLDDRPPLPGDGTDENTLPEPTSRPLKVDELDDPAAGQGHMADHPESFSATTTLPTTSGAVRSGAPSPPATLTERFVRSTSPELSSTRTAEGADWEAGQTQTDKGKGKAIEDHEAAVVSNS